MTFKNLLPTNGTYSQGGFSNVYLDPNTLDANGNPMIVINCNLSVNPTSEVDFGPIAVIPGVSHIRYVANLKGGTTGIRIGMDFYGANGRIGAWQSPGTPIWNSQGQDMGDTSANVVSAGQTKQIIMDFICPANVIADGGGYNGTYGYPVGTKVPPSSINPWTQLWVVTGPQPQNGNTAWYGDPGNNSTYLTTDGSSPPTGNPPPPTGGGTVGNTTIGANSDQNDANAQSVSYFTPNFTGQIDEITAYIAGATPGNCIAAVYAVSGGAAAALLEQSSPMAIGTSMSWVTFPLANPVNVTSGVPIGLALMANVILDLAIVAGTGQRDHNAVSSYTAGFANPFGGVWGSDSTGAMSIYATSTTPITPIQTYIVNWALTPTKGSLPFKISFSGYLSENSSAPDTSTIVNGETIQIQLMAPGGTAWVNTGITETTGSGSLGTGYFSGTWTLSEPGITPGAWQFRAYYAGNVVKNMFGCNNREKKKDLRKVNALIL